MNVFTCVSDENIKYAKAMLASLADSNRRKLNIFLCYSGEKNKQTEEIESEIEEKTGNRPTIRFINVGDCRWESAMEDILALGLSKILYISYDVIVKGDIGAFYDADVTGAYMAVCDDIYGRVTGSLSDEVAFDEGIMLFNTEEIRNNNDAHLEKLTAEKLMWIDWSLYDCPPVYYYMDMEAAKGGSLRFADYNTIKSESVNAEQFAARYTDITKQIAASAKVIHYVNGTRPWDEGRGDSALYDVFDKFYEVWEESTLLHPTRLSDEEILKKIEENEDCYESDGVYTEDFLRVAIDFLGEKHAGGEHDAEAVNGVNDKAGEEDTKETNGSRIWREMKGKKKGGKVLFLPYKAAMWDSLESVWKAASEDAGWDVKVSVIPYYDRKGSDDKTFAPENMHCEADKFPEYVDVTDYGTLDIENSRYDIIFIHNPYDQYNHVTSIDPRFYAPKLKDCAEKLIYIPYFVHNHDNVYDYYCALPGTIFSDHTILANEKVREQYIRYFKSALPEYEERMEKGSVEKKFLSLGSPKSDMKVGASPVPKEWKDKVYAGEKRKYVVFFNIHLSSFMGTSVTAALAKIKRVIRFFAGREDVVLLWRPHPLVMETIRSMSPAAEEPYVRILEQFRNSGVGILDESPDFHRAVEFSDMYYGGGGSTSVFFRQGHKPILYFNLDM